MHPKKSNILLTSFTCHIEYRLQIYLVFLQQFPNEILNFGSLWRHGVTQRHRFEKSHKWALLSRHEQLRKTCKQINKDHQDGFTRQDFLEYLKNNDSFSGCVLFHILSLCGSSYGYVFITLNDFLLKSFNTKPTKIGK